MRQIYIILITFLFALPVVSQTTNNPLLTGDYEAQKKWVDSLYSSMTLAEKVGQLYMVQVMSNQDEATKNKVVEIIKDHHIGGIIYSNGGPLRQARLNNELQSFSKTPMLIGMDAEWGLSMRLDSTYAFPWNMTLGAIKDNKLVEQTGRQIGRDGKGKEAKRDLLGLLALQLCPDPLDDALRLGVADRPARLALPAALLLEEVDQLARADLLTVVEVVPHVLLRQVLREGAAGREEATRGGDSAAGISTAWHGSP